MTPEEAILSLLAQRGPGRTICPSEAARAVAGQHGDWRSLMDDVRAAAFVLADRGTVDVTRGGEIVDGRDARGPIRLRLRDA